MTISRRNAPRYRIIWKYYSINWDNIQRCVSCGSNLKNSMDFDLCFQCNAFICVECEKVSWCGEILCPYCIKAECSCGSSLCEMCPYKCGLCKSLTDSCFDCIPLPYKCGTCYVIICEDCLSNCTKCNRLIYFCHEPYAVCNDCGESMCKGCFEENSKKCECCEWNRICLDCIDDDDWVYLCPYCDKTMCKDCSTYCEDCFITMCRDCSSNCSTCMVPMCERCLKFCERCAGGLCNHCYKQDTYHCNECKLRICSDCLSDYNCTICGENVCKDCVVFCIGCDATICDSCSPDCSTTCCNVVMCGYCNQCAYCGKYLLLCCEKWHSIFIGFTQNSIVITCDEAECMEAYGI